MSTKIRDMNDNIDTTTTKTCCLCGGHLPVPELNLPRASLLVAAVSFIAYSSTQWAGFTFDDHSAILTNEDISTTPLTDIFSNDFWGTPIASNTSHKSYRPLTVLTYRVNHALAGGHHNAWGFHFVNVALHCIVGALLLPVFSVLLGGLTVGENGRRIFTAPKASLLCALLFALHPIHTENVASIVGRADLLATIFFILSFLCYVKHVYLRENTTRGDWKHLVLCFMCATASVLSKEQGVTVLGVCFAYEVIMVLKINLSNWTTMFSLARKNSNSTKRMIWLVLVTVCLLAVRMQIMGVSGAPKFQYNDNPASFQKTALMRLLNYNYLYSLNAWLLFSPHWLCFDWAMGCVAVITTLNDPRLLAPLAMLVCAAMVACRIVCNLHTHVARCLAMSVAFIVLPFLPASNLFFRVGFVVAERNLYLPSVGFVMLFVVAFTVVTQQVNKRNAKVLHCFLYALLLIFFVKTKHRCSFWLDEVLLYTSGLQVCPNNAKVHYNVGKVNQDAGNDIIAERHYLQAISLEPTYDEPMNNLGNIYKDQGKLLEAEKYHQMSVHVNGKFAVGWMNLGTVQADLNKKQEAIECYKKATMHRKNYPDAFYNWANLYLDLGELELALEKFNRALELKPDHEKAWQNKIILLGDMGNATELEKCARKVSKLFGQSEQMFYLLGSSYGKAGGLKRSKEYLLKAIAVNPSHATAYANLGVVYHRLKEYDEAMTAYEKSLALEPNNAFTKENLKKLQRVVKNKQKLETDQNNKQNKTVMNIKL